MLHITTTDNNCAKNLSDLIDNSQENDGFSFSHYAELFRIANFTFSELCEKNKNLLVFPNSVRETYGSISDEKIFEMSGSSDFRGKPCDVSEKNSVNNDMNSASRSEQNVRHSERYAPTHAPATLDVLESVKNDKQTLKRVQGDTNIKIKTGNLMGFIGSGSTQIQITSRFAQNKNDFFFHYMLAKVFCSNLLNLKFDAFSNIKNQFDYLCFLFPLYLKNAMAQGIFKTYQKFERNDANVRGAINVPRHIAKNIPFAGKVAYTERARAYDNPLTELVRHTIELIKTKPFGKAILSDKNTKPLVSQIVEVTPSYNFFEREKIIFKNSKPLSHPFFTEWKPLQKLCLAILKNQKINFHADSNEVYGILFDGAWLWEEYLAAILKTKGFLHPENKEGKGGIKVFENNSLRFFPDFYDDDFVLDAKYKNYGETCVQSADYHQIISYMHLLKLKSGGFCFPTKNKFSENRTIYNSDENIALLGFEIPQNAANFSDFCSKMKISENNLASVL